MKRNPDDLIQKDLAKKMVFVTGARQVGKTTLSKLLLDETPGQYLNYDVAEDRAVILRQGWRAQAKLLVLDEIHKMPEWKPWLKGVIDGKLKRQQLLVTGSARLDTFRQAGESLAGRFFAWRLHPISVREWCEQTGAQPADALTHLLERGGFPEPFLADEREHAQRWRAQYITDLVREDVLEFSRVQEIGTLRLFVDVLRERVGSPLSLASIARDLAVSPTTLKRYLDILQALFIVFTVQPWHHNVARSLLQAPKVYFYDSGLVRGDEGLRFENAVAAMLLKHVEYQTDTRGVAAGLHYIRTKDGAEVDFALALDGALTHLIECKLTDTKPHRALAGFAERFEPAPAVQLVRHLRQEEQRGRVAITAAAGWLARLDA